MRHTLGISLKAEHIHEILDLKPDIGWFEVHTENYMNAGGPNHHYLSKINEHYDLSFHGVGLSIGSNDDIDRQHLSRAAEALSRYQPYLTSEHLSWSAYDGHYLADLLPVTYDKRTLNRMSDQVQAVQDTIGRQLLIENPSQYIPAKQSDFTEAEFLNALVDATDCGLLLDVNNVYVSAVNLETDPMQFLSNLNLSAVGEIHLAGHACKMFAGKTVLIDDHGSRVCDAVWQLYDYVISKAGARPSLIEWDTDIPPLSVFLEEADKAYAILARHQEDARAS